MDLAPALHHKLEICSCHMSRIIHKADKSPVKFIAEFEESLTRTFTAEWIDLSERAVKAAMTAFRGRTQGTVNRMVKAVSGVMGQYGSSGLESTVNDQLAIFYEEVTTRFIDEFSLGEAIEKAKGTSVGIVFDQKDLQAINVIQKIAAQSAGRYFPDQVSGKVAEVIEEVVLNTGLSTEEAAIKLQAELEGALGIKEAANAIPTRFAANPQAYFEILTSNASVQATNVGRMISMADAGVERYRIDAILDSRTSQICRTLNGKEFSVQKSMKTVDSFLAVSDLNDLEQLMPFNKKDEVPSWAGDGLGFPPYHHSCRTTVTPVGF